MKLDINTIVEFFFISNSTDPATDVLDNEAEDSGSKATKLQKPQVARASTVVPSLACTSNLDGYVTGL